MKNKCSIISALIFSFLFISCANEGFGGIGIEVPTSQEKVSKTNPYKIHSVIKGGSGESAGLKTNDIILSVDGRTLQGLQEDYIVKNLLRGKIGSLVILEIERETNGVKSTILYRVPRIKIVIQE